MPAAYWSMVGLLDKFTEGADEKTLTTEADALFRSLDGDNNGSIDKSELMKGFPHLDEGTVEILMTEADEDQNGSISFDELLKTASTSHLRRVLDFQRSLEPFHECLKP